MKQCSRCKLVKEDAEFSKDPRMSCGLKSACKECHRIGDKAKYQKAKAAGKIKLYKEKNADKISSYNIQYQRIYRSSGKKQERKLLMCMYKGGKCTHCGFDATAKTIAAFDFHHINPSEKEYTPSDMVMMKWGRIVSELDKCTLLCSNCHRIHHADNPVGNSKENP